MLGHDRSCSMFEYILEKHWWKTHNLSITIGIFENKTKYRVTFKTKTGYYVELLMPEYLLMLFSTWKY